MSKAAIRTYTSKIRSNDKNIKMLIDTHKKYRKLANCWRFVLTALYGGTTVEIALENRRFKEAVDGKELDSDLVRAIHRFRLVAANSELAKFAIPQPVMVERLAKELDHEPSDEAIEFLNAPHGEDYIWIDSSIAFFELKATIGDFTEDLKTIMREKYLPIVKIEGTNAGSVISGMFGTDEKADRTTKNRIVQKILEKIDDIKQFNTFGDLQTFILSSTGYANIKELSKAYKQGIGTNNFLDKTFFCDPNKKLEDKDRKKFKKSCETVLKDTTGNIAWNNILGLQRFLECSSSVEYEAGAFVETFKAALVDIQTKNTANYNYVITRLANKKELDSNLQAKENAEKLQAYFESPFFKADDKFDIMPNHFGGNNLSKLFDLHKKFEDTEFAVDQYCEDLRGTCRDPIRDLCKYILTLDLKAADVVSAAGYNKTKKQYEKRKLHPTEEGNNNFTFSPNGLKGSIMKPTTVNYTHRVGSPDNRIRFHLQVLNGYKAEKHHFYIHNSRFVEEVYAHNPRSNQESVAIRTKLHRNIPQSNLSEEDVAGLRSVSKKHRKATKRNLRTYAAIANNTLPNVKWNKDNCSIGFNIIDGVPYATINFKVPVKDQEKKKLYVGDRVLGFDQNQTTEYTLSITEVCTPNTPGAKPKGNYWVKVLKTHRIKANINAKNNSFDPLNYAGLPFEKYEDWRNKRRKFVEKHRYVFDKKGEIIDLLERLNDIESRKPCLYDYNTRYAKIMNKVVRKATGEKLEECRQEILEFLGTKQCSIRNVSSLNHHSLAAFSSAKGALYGYFVAATQLSSSTEEEKKNCDPEIFAILKNLEEMRQNKRKEKVNLISNHIMKLGVDYNCKIIAGEHNLSAFGDKKKTKKQNRMTMDWFARSIANKIEQMCVFHNIRFFKVSPHYTSHQDPFVHNTNDPHMKARFGYYAVEDLGQWHLTKLANYLNNDTQNTTAVYYNKASKQFLQEYNLWEYEDKIRKKKMLISELQEILKKNHDKVLIPLRGGRYYLATHHVTSDAVPFQFAGESGFLSDADEIASCNIVLLVFSLLKDEETEE